MQVEVKGARPELWATYPTPASGGLKPHLEPGIVHGLLPPLGPPGKGYVQLPLPLLAHPAHNAQHGVRRSDGTTRSTKAHHLTTIPSKLIHEDPTIRTRSTMQALTHHDLLCGGPCRPLPPGPFLRPPLWPDPPLSRGGPRPKAILSRSTGSSHPDLPSSMLLFGRRQKSPRQDHCGNQGPRVRVVLQGW
jgi:hypothetical protein